MWYYTVDMGETGATKKHSKSLQMKNETDENLYLLKSIYLFKFIDIITILKLNSSIVKLISLYY